MIVFNDAPEVVHAHQELLSEWLTACVKNHGFMAKEVSYSFLPASEMIAANRKHLDHEYLTDIITFDYSKGKRLMVDMLINFDFIRESAIVESRSVVEEIDRVLIHGLLHCIGFDDKRVEDQRLMRNEEDKCLLLRPKKLKFRSIE